MRFLAVLQDSFRETLDCKTFWVLFAVSSLVVLLAFSVSITALRPEEALGDIARGFDLLARGRSRVRHDAGFKVEGAREDGKGGYAFTLRAASAPAVHRLARTWEALAQGTLKKAEDPLPDPDAAADPELVERYLIARFRSQQLLRVSVEPAEAPEGTLAWTVSVRPERPELLHGAHRLGVGFGLMETRLGTSAAIALAGIERFLADVLAGLAGLLFAVVVTASFVPDMLQKGRIDVLLSRPLGRSTLLVYKYLGGLLYVVLIASYLVGGVWLGLAVRTGIWDPSFLLTVPVLTLVFGVLYAFSVWVGVATRSALVAILSTIALWFSSSSAGSFQAMSRAGMTSASLPELMGDLIAALYRVLPRTFDLKELNNQAIARSHLGAEAAATLPGAALVDPASWPFAVGSTLFLLAVFLAAACVLFRKRDY